MRWQYRDPLLIWLFVPAYLAHLAEEVWAGPGFPAWFALVAGRALPMRAFVLINGVALLVLSGGLWAAGKREAFGWVAIAVASALSLNAVLHLLGSALTGVYSPGLVTGVVLYVPLGMLTLVRGWDQLPAARFWPGVAAGIALHAVVSATALAAARG